MRGGLARDPPPPPRPPEASFPPFLFPFFLFFFFFGQIRLIVTKCWLSLEKQLNPFDYS